MKVIFSAFQAAMVREFFDEWISYYTDESILEPENLHADDRTPDEARIEIEKAKTATMIGNILTIADDAALLDDICHGLTMVAEDIRSTPKQRSIANAALAKLES